VIEAERNRKCIEWQDSKRRVFSCHVSAQVYETRHLRSVTTSCWIKKFAVFSQDNLETSHLYSMILVTIGTQERMRRYSHIHFFLDAKLLFERNQSWEHIIETPD
jgi:hypothetical protein